MKKIIFESRAETEIAFDDIDEDEPIFAVRDGKLAGIMVKDTDGWILKLGSVHASNGHWSSLLDCLRNNSEHHRYTFYTDITL